MLSDDTLVPADKTIDGVLAALFDVPALLEVDPPRSAPPAPRARRQSVADAFADAKVIGYGPDAEAIMEAVGALRDGDPGLIPLGEPGAVAAFVTACRQIRVGERGTPPMRRQPRQSNAESTNRQPPTPTTNPERM